MVSSQTFHPSISLSLHPSISPSLHLSISPSLHLSIPPTLHPSILHPSPLPQLLHLNHHIIYYFHGSYQTVSVFIIWAISIGTIPQGLCFIQVSYSQEGCLEAIIDGVYNTTRSVLLLKVQRCNILWIKTVVWVWKFKTTRQGTYQLETVCSGLLVFSSATHEGEEGNVLDNLCTSLYPCLHMFFCRPSWTPFCDVLTLRSP